MRATAVTRDLAIEKNQPAEPARVKALQRVEVVPADAASVIDLGDRRVSITPGAATRRAISHSRLPTRMWCSVVTWCGTRCSRTTWTRSRPSCPRLLRALRREPATIYVPGHGARRCAPNLDRYLALLDEVEQGARRSPIRGKTAAEGAAAFTLPPALGTWALFGPTFFERAFAAWYRELGAALSPRSSDRDCFSLRLIAADHRPERHRKPVPAVDHDHRERQRHHAPPRRSAADHARIDARPAHASR